MVRSEVIRVTADIPKEDVDRLEKIADGIHSNRTTALVRALRTTDLIREATSTGSKVMIIDKDGSRREIVF